MPDEKVMQLFRSGELVWIYSHLLSIANFARLLGKASPAQPAEASEKTSAQAKPPAPAGKATPAPSKSQDHPQRPARK